MCHLGVKQDVYRTIIDYHGLEGVVMMICQDQDHRSIEIGLYALNNFLMLGQKIHKDNPIIQQLATITGFFERLEYLQHHENK